MMPLSVGQANRHSRGVIGSPRPIRACRRTELGAAVEHVDRSASGRRGRRSTATRSACCASSAGLDFDFSFRRRERRADRSGPGITVAQVRGDVRRSVGGLIQRDRARPDEILRLQSGSDHVRPPSLRSHDADIVAATFAAAAGRAQISRAVDIAHEARLDRARSTGGIGRNRPAFQARGRSRRMRRTDRDQSVASVLFVEAANLADHRHEQIVAVGNRVAHAAVGELPTVDTDLAERNALRVP